MRFRHGFWLLLMGMLYGCTMLNGTTPNGSEPLFQAEPSDRAILEAVHREQEARLSTCTQNQSCDQVHFTRAMLALFQNGEAASAYFQQAIAAAPKGPFADSSARWIRFLEIRSVHPDSAEEPHGALGVMKGLVRTWLGQQREANASVTLRTGETLKNPGQAVFTLRQRIRSRDKRIAELTDQLSALKQIDSDAHKNSKLSLSKTPSK